MHLPLLAEVHKEQQLLEYLLFTKAVGNCYQLFFFDEFLECRPHSLCNLVCSEPISSGACHDFPPTGLLALLSVAFKPCDERTPDQDMLLVLDPVGLVHRTGSWEPLREDLLKSATHKVGLNHLVLVACLAGGLCV